MNDFAIGQQVVQFSFEEETGHPAAIDSISESSLAIRNNFNRPERITGVKGSALRLDGWSTWIEEDNFQIPDITNATTLECWYATESFTAANSAIISQEDVNSGFSLEVEPYGKLVFIFFANETRYVMVTENMLNKYQWNHIAVTVDLPNQEAKIYVNGILWSTQVLETHNEISLSENTLYIGRDTDHQEFAGFPLTVMNGALDELRIYPTVLSATEIENHYQTHTEAIPDLTVNPEIRHPNDHLRPQYHAMPNTSWTNEPYGLTYYDGMYHLFFQKNPNGPYLYFMHWGHLTSPDLVSWTEEKIALSPSPGFDSFGVWSGTTIKDENGKPVILYTGVDGAKAGIGLANPVDETLVNWEESPSNPVVLEAPTDIKNLDFRDPFLWKDGETYYMVVGSGLQFDGGGYLFTYKSSNLIDWIRIKTLYNDTNVARSGVFWEMPFFYKLNEKDWILSVTPTPTIEKRAETIYWIGAWENEVFVPYEETPKSLELISENLLAPAIGDDEAGQPTYIGIIPEDRNVEDQIAAGWRNTFSLPRVIRLLNDSTMGHIPHPNLCRLREENTQIKSRIIDSSSKFNLPEISGNQMELRFKIKADSASQFSIQILKNQNETEYTNLDFDLINNTIALDRRKSSLSNTLKNNRQQEYIFDHNDSIVVNIFIDHSILEVFVDQIVVFSCRVYPSEAESNLVDLFVDNGEVTIGQLDVWQLSSLRNVNSEDVCEPVNLPVALREKKEDTPGEITNVMEYQDSEMLLFPNPSSGSFNLKLPSNASGMVSFSTYSLGGKLLHETMVDSQAGELNLEHLSDGIYIGKLENNNKIEIFKIIIRK